MSRLSRQIERTRRLRAKEGVILDGRDTLACEIADQLLSRARIVVPADWSPPTNFLLYSPTERLVARVKLVWRSGRHAWVEVDDGWFKPESYPDTSIRSQLVGR